MPLSFTPYGLAHGPKTNLAPVGYRLCGTHVSETDRQINSIRSFMQLSWPVIVQCQCNLPICPIWACPWATNLSNHIPLVSNFARHIYLKQLGGFTLFEVGIVQHVVVQHHLWPWPWIVKVKCWKSRITGIGGPIDTDWKGCKLKVSGTLLVTLNFDPTYDLDLTFQGQIVK